MTVIENLPLDTIILLSMDDQIMQGRKVNLVWAGKKKRVFKHSLISGSLLPSSEGTTAVGLWAEECEEKEVSPAATLPEGDFPRESNLCVD